MASASAFLFGLAISFAALKILGVISWPWFLVMLPVTFPVLFFAAVGAIALGSVAAFFWVELIALGLLSGKTKWGPPL